MRMSELVGRGGFTLESREVSGIAAKFLLEDFDRHQSVEILLASLVDMGHATKSEVGENLVSIIQNNTNERIASRQQNAVVRTGLDPALKRSPADRTCFFQTWLISHNQIELPLSPDFSRLAHDAVPTSEDPGRCRHLS